MLGMGFGFVEAGTVTLRPQTGNACPRIFRDIAGESIINRMGFPGGGLEVFLGNVQNFRKKSSGILGVNIGINKDTPSPAEDYRRCMEALAPFADYIAINVSSPNTAGLRDLQGKEELDRLLTALMAARKKAVLLKIAPDLTPGQRADIAEAALKHHVDGLIISNTTVTRPSVLPENLRDEKGGLSGRLLGGLSTEVIRDFYRLTGGAVPIIGVGGISSAADAYAKIRAGASLVQVYTALVYQGPQLISGILEGLAELLKRDGFQHVSEAVGAEIEAGKAGAKAVV
jgi:dihydroorotate dehydrogenase